MKNQMTTRQIKAAEALCLAWNNASDKWNTATQEEKKLLDKVLDEAVAEYRKSHSLSSAFLTLDIINHYNTYHC